MNFHIICGDALSVLRELPDSFVQCVCSSPPYYGLRRYLPPGHPDEGKEIGKEQTPEEYVANLVAVFREVRRVLRADGVCWVNLGASFSSCKIESKDAIIRYEYDRRKRQKIAQALSSVWSANESAESALSRLLAEETVEAGKLSPESLSEVRGAFYSTQSSCGKRECEVLQPIMREVRQSGTKAKTCGSNLSDVRKETGEISSGHAQKPDTKGFLQPHMLVQLQPEGQSLSVGGGSEREDEPRGDQMEACDTDKRPISLSNMPCESTIGGASHTPLWNTQGFSVAGGQRDNSLSFLPREISEPGNRTRRDTSVYSVCSPSGLEDITFPKTSIPRGFEQFCESRSVLKHKDLINIPAMVAEALRADGWYLRSELIWAKGYSFHPTTAGSCMPESCKDRPTRSHEHIFMLTKSAKYFYDYEAVQEEGIWKAGTRAAKGSGTREGNRRGGNAKNLTTDPNDRQARLVARTKEAREAGAPHGVGVASVDDDGYVTYSGKRNLRSVWCINPHGFREAHFATYPEALVEPMIRAATSEKGCCPKCGAPWTRIVDVTIYRDRPRALENHAANANENPQGGYRGTRESQTVGWAPGCSCGEDPIPCLVLDPFSGAGTTLLAAVKLGRRGLGIELNQAYVDMANKRIQEAE